MCRYLGFAIGVLMLAAYEPVAADDCPVTLVGTTDLGPPLLPSKRWYGSESLAVQLPENGIWSTTRENARIATKVFWWSAAISADPEAPDPRPLKVSVRNLHDGANDARVDRPTNAHARDLGGWTLLTGIDFPSEGCWEITGSYLGQRLTFVVRTLEYPAYIQEFCKLEQYKDWCKEKEESL